MLWSVVGPGLGGGRLQLGNMLSKVETGFDEEEMTLCALQGAKKRKHEESEDRIFTYENARHRAWLQRGVQGSNKDQAWRPAKMYRVAAKRWAMSLDNHLRVCSSVPGLIHYQFKESDPDWSDWRRWPGLGVAMDRGSDGESAMNALIFMLKLNIWQWGDPSHGANRDLDMSLRHNNLWQYWLLMLISFNLPFGPDRDDYRYHQMRDAMKAYFATHCARDAYLYQSLSASIIAEHERAGVQYQGLQAPDEECWAFLAEMQHFAKVGRRTNLNRFMGSVEAAQANVPNWHTDLFERTWVCLSLDFLRGQKFLTRFKLRPGAAEEVPEGGGTTSSAKMSIEDSGARFELRGGSSLFLQPKRRARHLHRRWPLDMLLRAPACL